MANTPVTENEMAAWAVDWLKARLSNRWEITPSGRTALQSPESGVDAAIDMRAPNGIATTMIIVAKTALEPANVARLFTGLGRTMRSLANNVPVLIVAPWISQRTRELLGEERINYIDLTGNALVRLDDPALYIEVQGAARDPSPRARGKARVQGPKAGRLVRLLVDVQPPYGVRELADASSLNPGYVSRLLEALEDEALLTRTKRGGVESVDVSPLLRRWSESYDVFRSNAARRFVAPEGLVPAMQRLRTFSTGCAVTGSVAAIRFEQIAAPTFLAIYIDDPTPVIDELRLIPSDAGSNVVLLKPFDPVVFERTTIDDGIRYVAPSQITVDCLTGNGRMRAEGDAVLQWMVANESLWRRATLAEAQ
jgi:hypothetical protein